MLDESVSRLISDIYEGMYDTDAFDAAIERLVDLADARCVLVSCVDLRCRAYDHARFYGAEDGRFLDGVADYKAEIYRYDPTLRHALAHPSGGFVTLRGTLANSQDDVSDIDFSNWVEGQLGATDMTFITLRRTRTSSLVCPFTRR